VPHARLYAAASRKTTIMGRLHARCASLVLLTLTLSLVAGDGGSSGGGGTPIGSRFTEASSEDGGVAGAGDTGEVTTTASEEEDERPLPGLWWFAPVLSGGGYCSEAGGG